MVKSDRTWFIGEGNGKEIQYSCLENPVNNTSAYFELILRNHKRDFLKWKVTLLI